ncbi:hypothetical protein [Sphingomonas sp.]|uniref:hypothetical protein n=1 Tax=Sphingomonas sp. TaxID=28214 RepID=UPI002EDB042A
MAPLLDLQTAAITLPLDTVLEVLKGTRGFPVSEETMALMKVEVGSVICGMESLEEEVAEGILKDTFGEL